MARTQNVRIIWAVVMTGVAIALLAITSTRSAQGAAAPAKMADDLVDSIGVATHLNYHDTAYGNYSLIKNKLSDLGVRHVRDRAYLNSDRRFNEVIYSKYRGLAELGIKLNLTVDPRTENLESINSEKIASIAQMAGPSLGSFGGPNEYNKTGPDWAKELTDYQRDLYSAVNNSSAADTPVLGPALGKPYPSSEDIPDLRAYMDYGNFHPYPGGEYPSNWGLERYNLPKAQEIAGNKPLVATETGYHNATNNIDRPGVSEKAAAKYTPRLYFEYFNRGIARTYNYELMDERPEPTKTDQEEHFGLVRSDGTNKPVFTSLRNLISLLEDPGPEFETGSLNYSLSGNTENVHRTLLQKRDGRFYLVLWQEVSSYDTGANRNLSVSGRKVTLTLNQKIVSAKTYLPTNSVDRVREYTNPKSLVLNVPDHVLIVELTPANGGSATISNAQPKITGAQPGNDNRVADRTPTIKANVTDDKQLLKSHVKLFVDGKQKGSFSYNQRKDLLTFTKQRKMATGSYHRVKVFVRDAGGKTTSKRWKFKVVRSR